MSRFAALFCLATFALLVIPTSSTLAQVSDPVIAAQAPIPGSDHGYIGIGAETINPADGSLSFDLPLTPPAGRELSMPFATKYLASDQFHIVALSNNPLLTWGTNLVTPMQVSGWSYLLPTYTAEVYAKFAGTNPNYPNNPIYCDYTENYLFTGFDGVRR